MRYTFWWRDIETGDLHFTAYILRDRQVVEEYVAHHPFGNIEAVVEEEEV